MSVQTFVLSSNMSSSISEGFLTWWHTKSEANCFTISLFFILFYPSLTVSVVKHVQTQHAICQLLKFTCLGRWLELSADTNQWKATIYTAFIQYSSPFPNKKYKKLSKKQNQHPDKKYKKLSKNRINILMPITSIYMKHTCSTGHNIRPTCITTTWLLQAVVCCKLFISKVLLRGSKVM